MLSAILKSPGTIEIQDVPVPEPAEGELLVKVKAALTCGTDLKAYLRGHSLIPIPIRCRGLSALKGIFHFTPQDVKKAYLLLKNRNIDVKRLITRTCSLKELPSVFPLLVKGKGIKYAVLP